MSVPPSTDQPQTTYPVVYPVSDDFVVCHVNLSCTPDGHIMTTPYCDEACIINVGQSLLDATSTTYEIGTPPIPSSGLPNTGVNPVGVGGVAAILLVLGIGLTRIRRKGA